MGGHGGLNILPQKRWNVYNFDNREKVRHDEEEAAREEQLKREQARKRDTEFRLERLRTARGLAPTIQPRESEPQPEPEPEPEHGDAGHINLFEGIKIFDPIRVPQKEGADEREELKKNKKLKKEDGGSIRVVGPEDEKYRLGYGLAGKGVQLPWYLQKQKPNDDDDDVVNGENSGGGGRKGEKKKKTLEELREERLKRERREKEREKALRLEKQQSRGDVYGSRRFSRPFSSSAIPQKHHGSRHKRVQKHSRSRHKRSRHRWSPPARCRRSQQHLSLSRFLQPCTTVNQFEPPPSPPPSTPRTTARSSFLCRPHRGSSRSRCHLA